MPLRARIAEEVEGLADWSERQTRLVKTALRGYQSRTAEGRRKLSWQGVQSDIRDVTGVGMGGKDTLRQFVEGGRSAPVAERRAAIVRFLTHPEVDALSLDEFLAPADSFHAPKRLLEYLDPGFDGMPDCPLPSLCGTYEAQRERNDRRHTIRLVLQQHSDARVLTVQETHEKTRIPQSAGIKGKKNFAEAYMRKESKGWCVFTPEDNILFFLKEEQYGANHYYHLVSDVDIWTGKPRASFVLLRYDYPHNTGSVDHNTVMLSLAMSELQNDALFFRKIEAEAPCHVV